MISFDDLVNGGGDTEQLENEMREIRLNTQINRFSIIDCTNSIESLSNMMSTITVADYSASLSSLSSDTLALYNSLTTITGGGGFDYIEPYSAHSSESFIYNCNDILSGQSFTNYLKEVGPNINFDGVSFTTAQNLKLKGQTFNSCLIQSNSKPMMLDYKLFQNGEIDNNSWVNVSADEFKNNVLSSNVFINVSGFINSGNNYSQNNNLNITVNDFNDNTITSNTCLNICANSFHSNLFNKGTMLNLNCSENIANTFNSLYYNNFTGCLNKSNSYSTFINHKHYYRDFHSNNMFSGHNLSITANGIYSNTFAKVSNINLHGLVISSNSVISSISTGYFPYFNRNTCETFSGNSLSAFLMNVECIDYLYKNKLTADVLDLKASTIDFSNSFYLNMASLYCDKVSYMSIFNRNYEKFNRVNISVKTLDHFSFGQVNINLFANSITYGTFYDVSNANIDDKYLKSVECNTLTNLYITNNNLISSLRLNSIYNVNINNSWGSMSNISFRTIHTLKINGLDNGLYYHYKNSFKSIKELHLKNGNLLDSSLSNTFEDISSYYFKYTDGLYSGTDFISDYTSISNKAFIKYVPCSWLNQTFTSSGGSGGFDYWEGYVSHRQNGYNVSGTVKSALIVDNIYSLSPYANFSYCTFQSLYEVHSLNCEYFHTNSFFSNQTEINIKASEFLENTFMNCKMVNVSACTFTGNYYIANDVVNISAHNMKYSNTFNNNDIVNITCYNTDYMNLNKPVISGNNYVNIMADNLWSGVMNDNKFVNVNCKTIKYFNISNTFNNITAYYIGNNTIVNNNTNINCLFNFSCSNFNDNSVQVRTNSFNLSALYMADNTFSNCSYLTINAGNISRLQLYSDSQAISTNRVLKLKGNSIDSCNIMDYERVYLDCPIMKNIHLNGCSSIYLTTTYDFLKSWVYSSDYSNFNYSDKVIYGDRCSHFDFNDIDLVLDRFGGYSLTQIDKSKCYINGVPLIKLYPDA